MTYVDPLLPGLLLALLIALLAAWRRLGAVRWTLFMLWAGLFLCSWTPFNDLCLASLERWYSHDSPYPPSEDFEAIVVLAAGGTPPTPWNPDGTIGPGTYLRCQHAAWLYHNVRQAPIYVAGGAVANSHRTYAELMRELLLEKGVPPDQIWTEDQSRNTYENALFSVRMLREKGIRRIALVTEAYHMVRATGCFRRLGAEVVPAPTGFLRPMRYVWRDFVPRASALSITDTVLHEWVGLAWYWAMGRV